MKLLYKLFVDYIWKVEVFLDFCFLEYCQLDFYFLDRRLEEFLLRILFILREKDLKVMIIGSFILIVQLDYFIMNLIMKNFYYVWIVFNQVGSVYFLL